MISGRYGMTKPGTATRPLAATGPSALASYSGIGSAWAMADTDVTAPRAAPRPPSFDVLPPERCLELLSATTVGRIAFTGREGPVLLPVNFRVVDDAVVVRTSRSGTLGQLAGSDVEVVFEVDYHAPMARSAWSVLVRGIATVVEDARTIESVGVSRVVSWVPGDHSLVLSIPIERVTGRLVG